MILDKLKAYGDIILAERQYLWDCAKAVLV